MISKVRGPCDRVRGVGISSVRSVSILGSTTNATVCKTGTGGNIVLVAAGGRWRWECRGVYGATTVCTPHFIIYPNR